MKLHQMIAFREIMLTGSVSEAARNLHRSQPSVSASISALEDELEMKLFERRNGRLHPVPEAQYLLVECSELLERLDTVKRNMKGLKSLASGHLEIVSMPGPSVFLLPDMIASFSADRPNVSCELTSRSSDMVYQQIAAQQYDVGIADFMKIHLHNNALLNFNVLQFKCLCALPAGDTLTEKEVITPDDLKDAPIASLFPGHEIPANVVQSFMQCGLKPNVRFTARYFIPLMTFVEKGLAYAIVDPIAATSYSLYRAPTPQIVFRPFLPEVDYTVSVLTPVHRTASLLGRAFVEQVHEKLKQIGGIELTDFSSVPPNADA